MVVTFISCPDFKDTLTKTDSYIFNRTLLTVSLKYVTSFQQLGVYVYAQVCVSLCA